LDYLPGSVTFDPIAFRPDADLASRIVWFDGYVMNVDRTPRNTNMLLWHRKLWLIDHGSTLYFHHTAGWESAETRARDPFPRIREHVLLRHASRLEHVDAPLGQMLDRDLITGVVDLIPDVWLRDGEPGRESRVRDAYVRYLLERAQTPRPFLEEALRAR
jgi:hypothetical protein